MVFDPTLQNFVPRSESSYARVMRSHIEWLKSEADFPTIVRRWPHAVKTADAIVIPRFHRVSNGASITAYLSDGAISLRPMVEGRPNWQAERDRLLRCIEEELQVSLEEPSKTDFGEIWLDEEWGDFAVWVR